MKPRPWPVAFRFLLAVAFQACLLWLASALFDRGHGKLAALLVLVLPVALGYGARRQLALSLPATLLSYAPLPLLAAAYLRGIPSLVLTRSALAVAAALPPTVLAWLLAGLERRPKGRELLG